MDYTANRPRGYTGQGDSYLPKIVEGLRRVLAEYGSDSVKAAFELKGDQPSYWLDYLLRTRKGNYYRKRYPSLSVV